jgi:hypothetical protein
VIRIAFDGQRAPRQLLAIRASPGPWGIGHPHKAETRRKFFCGLAATFAEESVGQAIRKNYLATGYQRPAVAPHRLARTDVASPD